MRFKSAFTPQEMTPKTREQTIVLPKLPGDAVSIVVDIMVPELTELNELLRLTKGSFKLSFDEVDLVSAPVSKAFFDASFNYDKNYFFYGRLENEIMIYTIRLNIWDISLDYLNSLKNNDFILTIKK